MNILGAIKAIAEMPAALRDLTKEIREIGQKLNKAQAAERLAEKRRRNRAAVRDIIYKRLSGSEDGQRGEVDKPPGV